MTPQIEKLETDLGILDAQANEKDQELEQIPVSLIKIVKKNEGIIKKACEEKGKDELLEARLAADA